MSATHSSGVVRIFRLTNEPGGLGLSCTSAGVSLAGVPLLHSTRARFVPRPAAEIATLLKAAYGADGDPGRLHSRLGAIAKALNSGDFALAAIAAVHTRTPELSREAALRLANADEELAKRNFNPDEPRDWHGRWTTGGAAAQASIAPPEVESDRAGDPHLFDHRQRVADNATSSAAAILSDAGAGDASAKPDDGEDSREPTSLEQIFERRYDDLGPVDFAKEVIQFGDRLGREGKNLSPAEMARALAEYSFLQERLSFWLAYDYKPPTAQGNLLSAALTLYQGAVVGGFVRPGRLPESMLAVAGTASLFSEGPPQRVRPSTTKPAFEEAPPHAPKRLRKSGGLGRMVDNSETKIDRKKGLKDQNGEWEDYFERMNPDARRLRPGSKGFDHVKDATGEAISNKTLNRLSVTYIRDPREIYRKVTRYADNTINYERRTKSGLDPEDIQSRTIHLAIPEYTSPIQWRHLLRAIIYGKDNGVSILITRIRE
jgi:hypothetical protein